MHPLRRFVAFLAVSVSALTAAESLRPWDDYRVVMWTGANVYKQPEKLPQFFARLREMGVNGVTVHGDASAQPVLASQFSFYVENIVNRGLCLKFSSNVRDWDKFIRGWMDGGRPESAFVRDYSLDDPEWLGWARRQMQAAVTKHHANTPLAYDIRDELSTTISANPFDYDFSATSLAGFRAWLKTQYADLAALNAEWATRFADWDDVRPFTTDQIKQRMATGEAVPRGAVDWNAVRRVKFDPATAVAQPVRWNFAPWSDFRTYMDLALARALGDMRSAARAIDPRTPVGIEGTQMPSAFGGYDLWRLSQVIDWVEPYDIGNAREILGSFMPGKTILTTVFEKETSAAQRRLWHLLLEGDRGCIVWSADECIDLKSPDYALTAKGHALAPVFRELQSPVAELFRRAQREVDPIYFVYSQPSIQTDWLIESTADGGTWPRRYSSFEANHNQLARRRTAWMKLCQDSGYTPQFIAAENLGTLRSPAVVVLADTLAVSESEAQALAALKQSGARLLGNGPVGAFDEHGRLRGQPSAIDALVVKPAADIAQHLAHRLGGHDGTSLQWAQQQFALPRGVAVPPETHTRVHRFRLGDARLLAFERNIVYHMSEDLKQAGGNEALEQSVEIEARLDAAAHVYDLRTQHYLGYLDRVKFTLDPWQPSLFALLPAKLPAGGIVSGLLQRR